MLAFNLTDANNYPTSRCIIEVGEHERITIRSAVRYFSPKVWDAQMLQLKIDDGTFTQCKNASFNLIQKIIAGAYEDDTPEWCFSYLSPKPIT